MTSQDAYVIGCDVGSQAVKAVLLDSCGKILAEAGSAYAIDYPAPTWAEQPADAWIDAVILAIRRVCASAAIDPRQVRSIGLDAQVDGVVPVGKDGNALGPAIIWMDRRAVKQCETVQCTQPVSEIFRVTGLNLDPSHVAPKIRWLMENRPVIAREAAYFLLPGSYVAYRLTGVIAVDYSNASSTLLMDVSTRRYSSWLCDCFEIPVEKLAPILPATAVLGPLLPAIAEKTGLSPRTLVVLGSGDEHAACLGAGATGEGVVCDIAGTAEPVCISSPAPVFDDTRLVETHSHADPNLWLLENPGFVSGANYRWFRDQFAEREVAAAIQRGVDAYELLNQLAEGVPAGSEGLIMLPCLMGAMAPTWNAQARGTFLGFTLAHHREHFCRAVLEASAYAVRDITDQMRAMRLPLKEVRVVGGGARSRLWRQIKADVTGLPVTRLSTVETTATGAGILALFGSGLAGSLAEAVDATVQVVETVEPDARNQARYDEYYHVYRSAYFALLPVFEQAAKIS